MFSSPLTLPPSLGRLIFLTACLSLAAAVALGITRFAYGLLLPPMRQDLAWSYTLAGAMNTMNALGYLVGALLCPWALRRLGALTVLLAGAGLATVFMALTGFLTDSGWLFLQRFVAGVCSASVFVAGGLLAARLGLHRPAQSGLLLGIYYGGTGWGIALSALAVPALSALAQDLEHPWALAWWGLGLMCLVLTSLVFMNVKSLRALTSERGPELENQPSLAVDWRAWRAALLGYGLFGLGYIGYMTFVIALLGEQGTGPVGITFFYTALGLSVVASSRVWAGLLNHYKGGQALAILNALLGLATLLPALTSAWPMLLLSGILFGGVFLSLVASTTAMVKHNLAPAQWAAGISAFTVVFAAGQIMGPMVVGLIADGPWGLSGGLVFSAAALCLGAVAAARQKPLQSL
jgi:predicted MFS family arabinose efflux permease